MEHAPPPFLHFALRVKIWSEREMRVGASQSGKQALSAELARLWFYLRAQSDTHIHIVAERCVCDHCFKIWERSQLPYSAESNADALFGDAGWHFLCEVHQRSSFCVLNSVADINSPYMMRNNVQFAFARDGLPYFSYKCTHVRELHRW